jgi:zinc transporter ZupT
MNETNQTVITNSSAPTFSPTLMPTTHPVVLFTAPPTAFATNSSNTTDHQNITSFYTLAPTSSDGSLLRLSNSQKMVIALFSLVIVFLISLFVVFKVNRLHRDHHLVAGDEVDSSSIRGQEEQSTKIQQNSSVAEPQMLHDERLV